MNNFPNGFKSWQETHFEIISAIMLELTRGNVNPMPYVKEIQESQGRVGLYTLAKELTDKFETINIGREWNGEFFEEIDAFLFKELN